MARGKHKSRANGRRSAQQEATIQQLEAELAMEQESLAEAERVLAEVQQLQRALEHEQSALADEVAPIAEGLLAEREYLRSRMSEVRAHHSKIHETWTKFSSAAIDASPGATGLERIEAFSKAIGMPAWISDAPRNLSPEQATRIQRARGERHGASTLSHEARRHSNLITLLNVGAIAPDLIAPHYRQKLIDQGLVTVGEQKTHQLTPSNALTAEQNRVLNEAIDLAKRVWDSRAGDLDPAAVHAWGSSPIVRYDRESDAALRSLGWTKEQTAVAPAEDSQMLAIGLPLPSTPASTRSRLANYGAERTMTAWRDVISSRLRVAKKLELAAHPFAQLNPHPHPGQALATQNSYALAAYARWLNERDDTAWGHAAVGLTASATYWLPAGQTASFAESEPLNESDRAEMILPFPNVFLAFAEPLLLERSEAPSTSATDRWRRLSEITHDALRGDQTIGDLLSERSRVSDLDWPIPSLDQMIAGFGAQIEGVLLLADNLGRPDDRFAWCLTIRGAYGASLGRFVVPASRALTQYRDVIDNLTAVIAWAQWHEPDSSTEIPLGVAPGDVDALISTTAFKRDAKRAGAGIRVVNVGSTYRNGKSRRTGETEPDTHVSPHIRRGHWRRQRFGPGLEGSKRIRIAPVLVNAHRGDIAPRVYRLRQRDATQPEQIA
jgi:hypothetical protein